MRYKNILSTIAVASIVTTGCMGNGNGHGGRQAQYSTSSAKSVITDEVKASLSYMYDEERLAKEVYLAIYNQQPIKQLSKIASKSEGKHIDAVKDLAKKYGVSTPAQSAGEYKHSHIQSLYNELYQKGIRSQKDALEVGCIVEVTDIDDLNRYISQAENSNAQDIISVYDFLRRGSYNHYWAFDRGLKQIGVSDGCCSLGDKYCHPEYPQNQKGGRGQGRGDGRGRGWR
jgi:hypothetical protein